MCGRTDRCVRGATHGGCFGRAFGLGTRAKFLEDALAAHDLALFERHLAQCEGCIAYFDQISMTITLTGETSQRHMTVMPTNFADVVAALEERRYA